MHESLIGRKPRERSPTLRCCKLTALPQVRRLLAPTNAEWAMQVGQDLDETLSQ
jgi:hypothetical protein